MLGMAVLTMVASSATTNMESISPAMMGPAPAGSSVFALDGALLFSASDDRIGLATITPSPSRVVFDSRAETHPGHQPALLQPVTHNLFWRFQATHVPRPYQSQPAVTQ